MLPGPSQEQDRPAGMGGMLKTLAMLAVLLLAGFALALVFELIPREAVAEVMTRGLLAGGIVALALLALVFIGRGGRR